MFTIVPPLLILLAISAISIRADPEPNNPAPGNIFIEGKPCLIGWGADLTGIWKTMNIDLMTGDNFNMVYLTTVATVDGTDPTKNTFSYTCPQVTPHSAIYFYQFSSPATPNKTWTGRFAITDMASNVIPPPNATQPNGQQIPWGTGALVNASSSGSGSTSSSAGSVSVTTASTASSTSTSTPVLTVTSASASTSGTPTPVVVTITSTATTSVTPSAVSTPTTNSAVVASVSTFVFRTGIALGLAALGFAAVF